ncbi:MAG: DEDD exonuclease domain-containing protein [Actinomycetota bacterium]|nr:DEDD exonuclease domain-containing protein [Actinomycetota bacterium]
MRQRSFDELGTPLSEVTFCVVDLETTGGSPATSEITEIGACKVRRGEVVGTLQTLVQPREPVPAFIRLLTGISDDMLVDAPPIETVLPSFLEFVRGCVLVAHNARFDISFLNAALRRAGYDRLPHKVIDTANLARKVVGSEVPNSRLATLATFLRCAHQPCHRALPDVLATIDVLHYLIERVAGFGITTLEDLAAASATRMDGTFHKITLADGLPRGIGVYRFIGATGNTLYVGKATDIRTRVRSYFYGDPRRKIRDLLRETQRIDAQRCPTTLEAEITESRAIHDEQPPYNRAGKRWGTWYVKFTVAGRGKIAPARVPKHDGATYLGPFASVRVARALVEAFRDASAIHRCAEPSRCRGCAFSDLRRCAGQDPDNHRNEVARLLNAVVEDPSPVFGALARRMRRLADQHRYEEAADLRDRAAALRRALRKAHSIESLVAAGDIVIAVGGRALLIRDAQLAAAVELAESDIPGTILRLRAIAVTRPVATYLTADVLKEALTILSWLTRAGSDARLLHVDATFASRVYSADETFTSRSSTSDAAPESIASRATPRPALMS